MKSEAITYLFIVKGIVVGLFVGTVFLYLVKKFKLEYEENNQVAEEFFRSFSASKTWKELYIKIKKVKKAARTECGLLFKQVNIASVGLVLLATLGMVTEFRYWFILLILKVSTLCFCIVAWRCTLNYFRILYRVVLKNFSLVKPKEAIFKGALFGSLNLVLYANTLISLSLVAIVWIMNRHHLPESYSHLDYTRKFEFLMVFSLFTGIMTLIGSTYSSFYTISSELVGNLVSSQKFNLEGSDSRDPSIMSQFSGRIFSSITMDSGRYFFHLTTLSLTGLLLFSSSPQLPEHSYSMYFPITLITIFTFALIPSFLLTFVAFTLKRKLSIFLSLKVFLLVYLSILVIFLYIFCESSLPDPIQLIENSELIEVNTLVAWSCLVAGSVLSLLVGLLFEKLVEPNNPSVVEVIDSCKSGEGTGVILGLAFGFKSCLAFVLIFATVLAWSYLLAGRLGVWLLAAGSAGNLQVAYLYGFCCQFVQDNRSICGLMHLSSLITEKIVTVAGICTKANVVGEGMKLVCRYLIAFAGFVIFLDLVNINEVNVLSPLVLAGVMCGCMLPYAFVGLNTLMVIGKLRMLENEICAQCGEIEKFQEYLPDFSKIQDLTRSGLKLQSFGFVSLLTALVLVVKYAFGNLMISSCFIGFFISSMLIEVYSLNCYFVWEECKNWFGWFADPLEESCKKTGISVSAIGKTLKTSFGDTVGNLTSFFMILILVTPN